MDALNQAAQVRAGELTINRSLTRPDGRSYTTAVQEAGITDVKWYGENISWECADPDVLQKIWEKMEKQQNNIYKERYTHVGVGYVVGSDGKGYWSVLFIEK